MTMADQLRRIPSLSGRALELNVETLPHDPVVLFRSWLETALEFGVQEPHAVSLATVDAVGVPDARTLILKDVDERGWAFAGTASSTKGRQLAVNPVAAIDVYWQPIMRAVRVRGRVFEATPAECDADLAARSQTARASVAPGDWRLWRLVPSQVEFFQASVDRQHTRVVYNTFDGAWMLRVQRGGREIR
ncbi:pyridoxal 5'-phosphate synthase [Luteococcus sp.]|uniref:pyridoxine/pyridoxamine 5'-phosphate oxidase n=1 Tax=Luteococcus sp. TaxID=1969402 RepID=UPI0037353B91